MADDVELRAIHPFYRIRFDDGSWFDYSRDAAAMRAEVARFEPADLPGFDALMAEGEFCCKLGFDDLGATAFDTVGDLAARGAVAGAHAGLALRCTAWSPATCATRSCASCSASTRC